jgi:hypothetical protein
MVHSGEINPDTRTRHLLSVSDAKLDRLLTADRNGLLYHGICTTRPDSQLLPHFLVRTFSEWSDAISGSIAVDWVAFCGGDDSGDYTSVLSMIDFATIRVIFAPFMGRFERIFTRAVQDGFTDPPYHVATPTHNTPEAVT